MIETEEEQRFMDAFCSFIAHGREDAGLTQADMAQRMGITQAYYSRIEKGNRNIDLIDAIRICKILRLDLSEFLADHLTEN